MTEPSFRAQLVTRRTYNRPLDPEGFSFETWEQTIDRVIRHQRWLWERAKGAGLDIPEISELEGLRRLLLDRKVGMAGRTLWLGGTEIARTREASQFNCAFTFIEDVYDVVDGFWLLLQGCGVGFKPVPGVLNGFAKPVEVGVIRSTRKTKGCPENRWSIHTFADGSRVYHLQVGDSAKAWAKAAGKLLAMKEPVDKVILDFSDVRPAGQRLKGYGWICSGDEQIARAFEAICGILNRRAGKLLTAIDILDVMNWLGTTLSSRRSAEIAVMDVDDPEAEAFAVAKQYYWINNPQRAQSNNSIIFWHKPSKYELRGVFQQMLEAGGSDPGFINGVEAKRRAPWFKGVNPCAEILLGNKSFCNLVTVDLGKFIGDWAGLKQAVRLAARANYRQTCVNLKDGVLSETWHELNEFLRLCGGGLGGIVKYLDAIDREEDIYPAPFRKAGALRALRKMTRDGAFSMADELGLPRPKAVTTVKPDGTFGKIADTTEGAHRPLGKYIFNNIQFSRHDPLVQLLREANYRVFDHPHDPTSVLATIPVSYEDVEFTEVDGLEVNQESAVEQLERYKLLMDNYVDHNCSITVSYSPEEVQQIVDWLYENWDSFVGVSWMLRADPTTTAEELGHPYLPQEVVTKETYDEYVSKLKPVNLDAGNSHEMVEETCSTGACPIR